VGVLTEVCPGRPLTEASLRLYVANLIAMIGTGKAVYGDENAILDSCRDVHVGVIR